MRAVPLLLPGVLVVSACARRGETLTADQLGHGLPGRGRRLPSVGRPALRARRRVFASARRVLLRTAPRMRRGHRPLLQDSLRRSGGECSAGVVRGHRAHRLLRAQIKRILVLDFGPFAYLSFLCVFAVLVDLSPRTKVTQPRPRSDRGPRSLSLMRTAKLSPVARKDDRPNWSRGTPLRVRRSERATRTARLDCARRDRDEADICLRAGSADEIESVHRRERDGRRRQPRRAMECFVS
jgi:hypothetical protein